MKDFFEPLVTNVWDSIANLCTTTHGAIDDLWIIIIGIVLIVASFCFGILISRNSNSESMGKFNLIMLLLLFITIVVFVFNIGLEGFKPYRSVENNSGWITFLVLSSFFIVLILINMLSIRTIIYVVLFFVCSFGAAILFSKYVWPAVILLSLTLLGGGSTYVGTFTDKNGNSFDIYRKG